MTGSDVPGSEVPDSSAESSAESEWERKARLARIFGDVVPESTMDDRDEPSPRESGADAWLKAQVPPHHGS